MEVLIIKNEKMRKLTKIILFIIILGFLIIMFLSNNSETKADLSRYNQLYNSKQFETRLDYRYLNETIDFKCLNQARDCSNNGNCTTDGTDCNCLYGWYTFPGSYIRCSYQKKSKITALLLETFISFGFGHLYLGNFQFFIVKFLLYFFTYYYIFCVMVCIGAINDSNVQKETYIFTKKSCVVMFPIIIGWYLFDIIWIILDKYTDSNSVPLI